jgi:hypothetical protein
MSGASSRRYPAALRERAALAEAGIQPSVGAVGNSYESPYGEVSTV